MLADIVAGLASGMSICFFAIFLYENLKLCLTMVQVIYIVNPLLQAVLIKVGKKHLAMIRSINIILLRQHHRFLSSTIIWWLK